MANNSSFLGWDIKFKDTTNNIEYDTDIVDLAIGQDNNSCVVMCTIKFSVDTSLLKYFIKPHNGKLTLVNKMVYTHKPSEIHTIELQSVTNAAELWEREENVRKTNITMITMHYMCKGSASLMNERVGGIYHKKKLEEIIQDLYQQTKCQLPLNMAKLNNTQKYDCVMIPESSFIESMRYITQEYGIYDNMFLMFGETLTKDSPKWIINNANKIKREQVRLYFTPYEQVTKDADIIDEHKYYTPIPISINNNFVQIVKKMPKMLNLVSFDRDRFMKRKDIKFASTLKELKFLNSNQQFDKKLERDKQMFFSPRFDMKDFAVKDAIQKIGVGAYQIPELVIPNPIKLSHFQIGTTINFDSQIQGYSDTNVKLMVLGWLLRIRQGNGIGGGATWSTRLTVRTVATSYLGR